MLIKKRLAKAENIYIFLLCFINEKYLINLSKENKNVQKGYFPGTNFMFLCVGLYSYPINRQFY